MGDFKNLKIWQKGMEIASKTFQFVTAFPKEEKYGLCLQMTKAGISIPSNIAEGCSRRTAKDFNRFIEITLGSTYELETQVHIALELNFGDPVKGRELLMMLDSEEKMLTSFSKSLKSER
jgi:four helix bundle protein